eukprot:4875331-Ditylum_brightwellii.AAC.1
MAEFCQITCCVSLVYVQYRPMSFPSKNWWGAPASLPSAPHQFLWGISFGVASFVFEACTAELLVATGLA